MIKVAFCDDSNTERSILKKAVKGILDEMKQEAVLFEFNSGEKLSRNYSKGDYDIIFLDIQMKQLDGIETGKVIRKIDSKVEIIYATSSDEYFKDGYGVHALSYILKPYDIKQLRETLEYYFEKHNIVGGGKKEMLGINIQQKQIFIRQRDICWMESVGRVVNIYCKKDVYKIYARLNDIEQKLNSDIFLRCNQSYIVNIEYVDDIVDYDFYLKNDTYIPIRKRDKKEIIQKYYNKKNWLDGAGEMSSVVERGE